MQRRFTVPLAKQLKKTRCLTVLIRNLEATDTGFERNVKIKWCIQLNARESSRSTQE